MAWNSSFFMLTGGHTSKTFYYQESEWIPGPELNRARGNHAAGLGVDRVTNDPYIAVTGGTGDRVGNTVELLYQGETVWQAGKQKQFHY